MSPRNFFFLLLFNYEMAPSKSLLHRGAGMTRVFWYIRSMGGGEAPLGCRMGRTTVVLAILDHTVAVIAARKTKKNSLAHNFLIPRKF